MQRTKGMRPERTPKPNEPRVHRTSSRTSSPVRRRTRRAASGSAKARIWRILGFNFTNVLAPAEGLHPTSSDLCTVFGFCYLLVWGYIADLSMVPRLRRGRLAGRALSHPFILRGQNSTISSETCRPPIPPLGCLWVVSFLSFFLFVYVLLF